MHTIINPYIVEFGIMDIHPYIPYIKLECVSSSNENKYLLYNILVN